MSEEKLVVIYDTFCGWCYGAAPVFDALVETDANVEVLHRHLFKEPYSPKMSEGKGAQILQTLPHLEALTGQYVSEAFKNNIALSDTEVLESGLSAQAAALVHEMGAQKEFAVRQRLEHLHFGEGMSSANRQAIIDALIEEGIAPEEAQRIGTPELEAKAVQIAERAQSLMNAVGSRGVPTVLKIKGDEISQIDHQVFYGKPQAVPANLNELSIL